MTPKLSIVTICYNEVNRIEATLQSVLHQTYTNYEYIVVDGASTDGTVDILHRHKEHFSVFISEPDQGIYNAMNKAISYCKGDYIYFLNGGDVLYEKEILTKIFSYEINGDLIYGNIAIKPLDKEQWILQMPVQLTKTFLLKKTIPHQATFTHRDIFSKVGKYDESFKIVADYKLSLLAIYKYDFCLQYIPETFAVFELSGVSHVNADVRNQEKRKVQEEVFGKLNLNLFIAWITIKNKVLNKAWK